MKKATVPEKTIVVVMQTKETKFTSLMIDKETKEDLKERMIESRCKSYPEFLRLMMFIYDKTKHLNFSK